MQNCVLYISCHGAHTVSIFIPPCLMSLMSASSSSLVLPCLSHVSTDHVMGTLSWEDSLTHGVGGGGCECTVVPSVMILSALLCVA